MEARERPIILSVLDARAIWDGKKTQERKVMARQEPTAHSAFKQSRTLWGWHYKPADVEKVRGTQLENGWNVFSGMKCPYGVEGDRLWVKEPWAWLSDDPIPPYRNHDHRFICWQATMNERDDDPISWQSARLMPRWASRFLLEITQVRVVRLHEVTDEDARGLGVADDYTHFSDFSCGGTGYNQFRRRWTRNGGSWNHRTWAWALSFRQVAP